MSSPVAASAIKTNKTKVVGTGLMLKSNIDAAFLGLSPETAKAWQKNVEREFALWASKKQNCDAIGVNSFTGLQQLAVQSWLTNGDVFASVFAGAVTRGKSAAEAAALAADVVCEAIKATDDGHWYGVSFERAIPFLVRSL